MPSPDPQRKESSSVEDYGLFIGGKWRDGATGERFDAINPYTQQAWATHACCV